VKVVSILPRGKEMMLEEEPLTCVVKIDDVHGDYLVGKRKYMV
jgi:hypothetical protein